MADLTLSIKLTADAANALGGLQSVERALSSLTTAAKGPDQALNGLSTRLREAGTGAGVSLNPLNGISRAFEGLAGAASLPIKAVGGLVDALGHIGLAAQGVDALVGAAKGLGATLGVGLASEMETTRAQLLAFVKDGAQADAILAQIRKEADATPFAFQELAKATAGLIPSAKQANAPLMDLVKTAEILAASHPEQGLEGAAFALREAVSGDFTSVIERFDLPRTTINQLKAEGVPALEAVRQAMQAMGYDASLVGNLAATTAGRFSTFQDAIDGLRQKAGQPILDALGRALDQASATVEKFRPQLEGLAGAIGNTLAGALDRAAGFLGGAIQEIATLGVTAQNIAGAHGIGLIPAALSAVEIRLREVFGDRVADTFHDIREAVEKMGSAFGDAAKTLAPLAQDMATWVAEQLPRAASLTADLAGKLAGLTRAFSDNDTAVRGLTGALEGLLGAAALGGLAGLIGKVGSALALVTPEFALFAAGMALAGAVYKTDFLGLGTATDATVDAIITGFRRIPEDWNQTVAANLAVLDAMKQGFNGFVRDVTESIAILTHDTLPRIVTQLQTLNADAQAAAAALGQAIVQGIGNAIAGGLGFVRDQAARLAQGALDAAKQALGIASPSREFEEVGEQLVAGFTAGIEQNAQDAAEAVGQMAEATLDSVANALGAVFEKTFSLVEQAQNEIDNARADADRAMYRAEEIEATKHGRRMAELERDLGAATGKARQAVQEKIADEQRAHLQRLEDIQRQHDDKIVELEFDAADKIAGAQRKQNEARGAALREFSRGIDDATRDAERSLAALNERVSQQLQEAFDDAVKAATDARDRAAQQIQDLTEGRALDLSIRVRREAFDTTQDAESLARSRTREDAEQAYRYKEDLADAERDLNKDLQKAKTDEDRTRLRERYQDQVADLRQRFEDQKRDLAHRRQLEDDDREYRRQQAKKLQDFNDTLEREALQRSIARINEDARTRVTEIGKALADKQRQIETQANKERETLAQSLRDRVADLEAHLREKIGPLLADEETMLTTWLGGIATKVGELVGKIMTDTAAALAKPLPGPTFDAGGLSTAQNPTRWGGISDATQEAIRQNVAAADPGRDTRPRNPDGTIAGVPTPRLPNGEIDWGAVNARASGGPVTAGVPYWVGEAGPEPFIPAENGYILPAGTVSRGGGMNGGMGWTGGATYVTVTVNLDRATLLGGDKQRVADELADAVHLALLQKQRRGGPLGLN